MTAYNKDFSDMEDALLQAYELLENKEVIHMQNMNDAMQRKNAEITQIRSNIVLLNEAHNSVVNKLRIALENAQEKLLKLSNENEALQETIQEKDRRLYEFEEQVNEFLQQKSNVKMQYKKVLSYMEEAEEELQVEFETVAISKRDDALLQAHEIMEKQEAIHLRMMNEAMERKNAEIAQMKLKMEKMQEDAELFLSEICAANE